MHICVMNASKTRVVRCTIEVCVCVCVCARTSSCMSNLDKMYVERRKTQHMVKLMVVAFNLCGLPRVHYLYYRFWSKQRGSG